MFLPQSDKVYTVKTLTCLVLSGILIQEMELRNFKLTVSPKKEETK